MSRNAKIRKFIILIFAIFVYSFSIFLPIYLGRTWEVESYRRVDPEIINGILTASAIILGLSTIPIRKREVSQYAILVMVFALQVGSIYVVGTRYFGDYLHYGYASFQTLQSATISLFITLSSWFIIRMLRIQWVYEDS